MMVQSISITDYSTGKQYVYSNNSGTWQSIQAVGGKINGNANGQSGLTVTATASTPSSDPSIVLSIPVGGIGTDKTQATATQTDFAWLDGVSATGESIPSGWHINPNGRIAKDSAGTSLSVSISSLLMIVLGHVAMGALALAVRI
jgi:hypothetical protein